MLLPTASPFLTFMTFMASPFHNPFLLHRHRRRHCPFPRNCAGMKAGTPETNFYILDFLDATYSTCKESAKTSLPVQYCQPGPSPQQRQNLESPVSHLWPGNDETSSDRSKSQVTKLSKVNHQTMKKNCAACHIHKCLHSTHVSQIALPGRGLVMLFAAGFCNDKAQLNSTQ